MIATRDNIRKIGMKVNGDCPFCDNHLKDIDYLFIGCPCVN